MGICLGKDSKAERISNLQINKQLRRQRQQNTNEMKILLLGAGGSGKSTVFKQMSILHQDGFSKEYRDHFIDVVRQNIVLALKNMLLAIEENDIRLPQELENAARAIRDLPEEHHLTQVKEEAETLWASECIRRAWALRNCYHIEDSAKPLLDRISEVAKPDYVPTDSDILYARSKTTGVLQNEFTVAKKYTFRMIDVGGQRNERKKWIHCFQDVGAVLYIASLTGFDELCVEDDRTNRMKESLSLFEDTVNSQWFTASTFVLFLNKKDILEEKLQEGKDPSSIFPSYKGGADYDEAVKFVEELFRSKCRSKRRKLYAHTTCATDTKNIETVFKSVQDSLFDSRLSEIGLV
eukprot:gb/GECH01014466.1/.p1 GENE.gb/GECH01014466.1/~~gb/GECH01014466.1/.p1  ORF type:complete len:351 (+),score=90.77 gb/GECH01014466.1/:1-1053(+)